MERIHSGSAVQTPATPPAAARQHTAGDTIGSWQNPARRPARLQCWRLAEPGSGAIRAQMTQAAASNAFPAPEHDHDRCLDEAMERARAAFYDKGLQAHAPAPVGVPGDRRPRTGRSAPTRCWTGSPPRASGWRRSRSTGRSMRWWPPASCTASRAATPSLPATPATSSASWCWPARPAAAWPRSTATRCSPPSTAAAALGAGSRPRARWSRSGACAPSVRGQERGEGLEPAHGRP